MEIISMFTSFRKIVRQVAQVREAHNLVAKKGGTSSTGPGRGNSERLKAVLWV
jgi:hypothetical protein